VNTLRAVGGPIRLGLRTAWAARQRGLRLGDALMQLHEIGTRSAWLVLFGMGFFGAVMVVIANVQARRFIGNLAIVGPAYFELMIREFGPLLSALLAAARAGAGTSAELSSMSVNEQLEALEMSAGDPLADLVAPRLAAGLVGIPALCVLGTAAASLSAALTASWVFGVDGASFVDPRFVDGSDLVAFGLKAVGCGGAIPLVTAWYGMAAQGGAPAVGDATTRGVVAASLACLGIDLFVGLPLHGAAR
jgi:phospholipid/cholesterol/gamma-HCH transport system permease protein